jgi:hypothetical protein
LVQFDFQSINVATIRDGFKGDYYYQLTVAENIPDSLRGKLIALNVTLKPQYFDRLPGPTDPTVPTLTFPVVSLGFVAQSGIGLTAFLVQQGIHDYQLSIPQIMFGVPLAAASQWPDEVFWTSGFAHNLQFTHTINSDFKVLHSLPCPLAVCSTDPTAGARSVLGQ